MRGRILIVLSVVALALASFGASLAVAEGAASAAPLAVLHAAGDGEREARLEAAAAAAAEANPPPDRSAALARFGRSALNAPLFAGVGGPIEAAFAIDPATAAATPLFQEPGVWAAAYDPNNERILFADGTRLYQWPLDGSPSSIGLIRSSVTSATLSIGGLAYISDTLVASRYLGSKADPEGIYAIDPETAVATLYTTFQPGADKVDLGGLEADPDTGTLYGLNDDADLRGFVRVGGEGEIEVLVPYPEGEDDIDGLAIGDGIAYLVTDEPGDIYTIDLATLTYTQPITAPWVSPTLFSGAAWAPMKPVKPGIVLTKTVGADPAVCAAEDTLTLDQPATVVYCYTVENTGNVSLTLHDLDDSALGSLADGLEYPLGPGASTSITRTADITETTANTATWTAYNPGPTDVVSATAAAIVTILPPNEAPEIEVSPTALSATLPAGTQETLTFTLRNTGTADLAWTIAEAPQSCQEPVEAPYLEALPSAGTTAPGEEQTISVDVNATDLAVGDHAPLLCVTSNDEDEPLTAVSLLITVTPNVAYLPIVAGGAGPGR